MLKDNLIMLRNINGLSQETVAEVIGISRQAYAKWEQGDTIPDVEKCMKLAEYYGTTIDSLVAEAPEVNRMKLAPAPKGKHIWGTVVVGERGQIVIPKDARDTFDIKGGDRLIVLGEDDSGIALIKVEEFEAKVNQLLEFSRVTTKPVKNEET